MITRDEAVLQMVRLGYNYNNEDEIWTKNRTNELMICVSLPNITVQWLIIDTPYEVQSEYFKSYDEMFIYLSNPICPSKKEYRLVVDEIIEAWTEDEAKDEVGNILLDSWELIEIS